MPYRCWIPLANIKLDLIVPRLTAQLLPPLRSLAIDMDRVRNDLYRPRHVPLVDFV
jgi:hypothetical protein